MKLLTVKNQWQTKINLGILYYLSIGYKIRGKEVNKHENGKSDWKRRSNI